MLRKVGVRPSGRTTQSFTIDAMTLDEHVTQTHAQASVVVAEDTPCAVTIVVEPTSKDSVDLLEYTLQRFARLARRELDDSVHHLAMTLRSWKAKLIAK